MGGPGSSSPEQGACGSGGPGIGLPRPRQTPAAAAWTVPAHTASSGPALYLQVPAGGERQGTGPLLLQEPLLSCVPHRYAQEVSRLCLLPAGTYRIVPSTYLPDSEGAFTVTVATRVDRWALASGVTCRRSWYLSTDGLPCQALCWPKAGAGALGGLAGTWEEGLVRGGLGAPACVQGGLCARPVG